MRPISLLKRNVGQAFQPVAPLWRACNDRLETGKAGLLAGPTDRLSF